MNDIVFFLILVFILIAFVCAPFVITEIKFLILMLKIKSLEKLCEEVIKDEKNQSNS